MQDTVLNMIQFPYRFYPYALFMVICGMTIVMTEKRESRQIGNGALVILAILTVVCGMWQAKYCYRKDPRVDIDTEYLYANTCLVGKGEWVPEGVTEAVFTGESVDTVLAEDGTALALADLGYNDYRFEMEEANEGEKINAAFVDEE